MKGLPGLVDKLSSSTDEEVEELFNKRKLSLDDVVYDGYVASIQQGDRVAFSVGLNEFRAKMEAALLLTVVK